MVYRFMSNQLLIKRSIAGETPINHVEWCDIKINRNKQISAGNGK